MTRNLRSIFLLSIPIFVVHGTEEYLTGFADVDSSFAFVFQPILKMSVAQGTFLVFQMMLWLLLIVSGLLLLGEQWQRRLLICFGIIYVLELHHIIEAAMRLEYYPGLLTSFAFPFLAFFFWKEWLYSIHPNTRFADA